MSLYGTTHKPITTDREEGLQACLNYFLSLHTLSDFNNTLDVMSASIVEPGMLILCYAYYFLCYHSFH